MQSFFSRVCLGSFGSISITNNLVSMSQKKNLLINYACICGDGFAKKKNISFEKLLRSISLEYGHIM